MKKTIAKRMAAALFTGCLALSACGGAASSSQASSSAKTEAVKADPSEKFIGEWKLAGMESQGVTMTGDLSAVLGDDSESSAETLLTVKDDGTGKLVFASEGGDFTWKQKNDDAITIEVKNNDDSTTTSMDITFEDDSLQLEMKDEEMSGTLIFTADGKSDKFKEITVDKATAIKSESELLGSWKLSGMNMMGMSVYGDVSALAEMSGQAGTDTSVTFESGGKCTLMGQECTWAIGSDGATIDLSGVTIPVKALDKDLTLDLGSLLGAIGSDMKMVYLYSK